MKKYSRQLQHDTEERIYRALREWFDTPPPLSSGGVAAGQLTPHQTKLLDKLCAVVANSHAARG